MFYGTSRAPPLSALSTAARSAHELPTANSAQIGTDIATRSFFLHLKSHAKTKDWERAIADYIDENRFSIFIRNWINTGIKCHI